MSKLFVAFVMLLVVSTGVLAADVNADAQAAVKASVDQANRFLAAEVTKQMAESQKVMVEELKANNDDNFRIFDQRMNALIQDVKMKIVLLGLGSVMIANAIVSFFLIQAWRKYSYERYLEQVIDRQTEELSANSAQMGEFMKTLEPTWTPQQPTETVGMRFGQAAAAEMSQMNAWQMQPVYQGAWVSPQQPNQPYQNQPYQDPYGGGGQ
jgi:hypothetical protein